MYFAVYRKLFYFYQQIYYKYLSKIYHPKSTQWFCQKIYFQPTHQIYYTITTLWYIYVVFLKIDKQLLLKFKLLHWFLGRMVEYIRHTYWIYPGGRRGKLNFTSRLLPLFVLSIVMKGGGLYVYIFIVVAC